MRTNPRTVNIILHWLFISLAPTFIYGQATSSAVEVIKTYSQNGRFYLRSIPYDNEFPTLRGKTYVYETGRATPVYVFERGFDSVDADSNNLILSDDGEVIFYLIPWEANEQQEGLKSVTVYRRGTIVKSYTETELTGCDKNKERCSLVYSNFDQVIDRERSNWGTGQYKKVFKDGISDKEKFLNDFAVFSAGDTVYVTDSKKRVHLFSLKEGNYVGSKPFDDIFDEVKSKGRFTRTEVRDYEAPIFMDFPRLKSGRATETSLARYLGMKTVDITNRKDEQYKWYSFTVNSTLLRDGSLEIEKIDVGADLPKEKIINFFKTNRFDTNPIPAVFEKWNIGEEYFFFRKRNDQVAKEEKRLEKIQQRKDFEVRLTLENINGVYIPKDLEECFVQLDKLLPQVDKTEMKALPNSDDMVLYHHGLGTWIRNNWGLWGGSRLQKYFRDRAIAHPDNMSGIVLRFYYDWLHDQNNASWKEWEKNPKRIN